MCCCEGLFRPILMVFHVLLIALVVHISAPDRQWNLQVQGQSPFPQLEKIYGCNHSKTCLTPPSLRICCSPENLPFLSAIYSGAQRKEHSTSSLDAATHFSGLTLFLCLLNYVLELVYNGTVDSKSKLHLAFNRVGTFGYLLAILMLSVALYEMTPGTVTDGDFCGTPNGPVPAEVERILDCFEKTGACRDQYPLLYLLIFLIAGPIICILGGCLVRFCADLDDDLDEDLVDIVEAVADRYEDPRERLGIMLNAVKVNPNSRYNSEYLALVGQGFQDCVRAGHIPSNLASPNNNLLQVTTIPRTEKVENVNTNPFRGNAILHSV